MDDLSAQGCRFGDPAEPWPVSRVLAGVEQLAALHAGTWNAKAEDYPWLTAHYDQAILSLMETYDQVVHADNRPPGIPDFLKDQARITAVLEKHYRSRNPLFQCMVHGDAHTGNTYLVQDQPRFLDWQIIHIGSALHDVAYLIGGALTIEDRRAHETEVLDHYLETLASYGGPVFFRAPSSMFLTSTGGRSWRGLAGLCVRLQCSPKSRSMRWLCGMLWLWMTTRLSNLWNP